MRRMMTAALMLLCLPTLCCAQKDKRHLLNVGKNLEIFSQVYKHLDLMYVDSLNPEDVIGSGIKNMLESLDPYTKYYPENDNKELKMMLTGKYAGIGALIRYNQQLKRVVIDEPYEGMPAVEAGLKKGDIILSIDGEDMSKKNVAEVSSKLRGDAGTTFTLKIKRPTTNKKMSLKITRRSIKLPEIPYYGMLEDGVGYLNLNSYTEGCAKQVRRAYIDLKKQGAGKFILDLRENGGGSLSEAIDIVNMWVPKGVTLVETKGKLQEANRAYTTRMEPVDTLMPLVVLVNENTASASEITAGSIQDLDRGLIVGTRTYGKGLVQVPVSLPYNATLKLTTSKYYIPSGRCIQAINYKHTGGGYTERIPDSLTHVFHTRNGREVRDGGGIKPDIEVRPDTLPNIALYMERIDSTEAMHNFVIDYIASHPTIASPKEFSLTDEDFEALKQRAIKGGFTYDQITEKKVNELIELAKFEGYYDNAKEEFERLKAKLKHNIATDMDRHKQVIKQMVEADIIPAYYYQRGAIEASVREDKTVKEALRLLKDEKEYQERLKGVK
ncbi:MAG: S41 family peptidase [Prevotella sp.]